MLYMTIDDEPTCQFASLLDALEEVKAHERIYYCRIEYAIGGTIPLSEPIYCDVIAEVCKRGCRTLTLVLNNREITFEIERKMFDILVKSNVRFLMLEMPLARIGLSVNLLIMQHKSLERLHVDCMLRDEDYDNWVTCMEQYNVRIFHFYTSIMVTPRMQRLMARNRSIQHEITRIILLILCAAKWRRGVFNSELRHFGVQIAKEVHASRGDLIWLKIQ